MDIKSFLSRFKTRVWVDTWLLQSIPVCGGSLPVLRLPPTSLRLIVPSKIADPTDDWDQLQRKKHELDPEPEPVRVSPVG